MPREKAAAAPGRGGQDEGEERGAARRAMKLGGVGGGPEEYRGGEDAVALRRGGGPAVAGAGGRGGAASEWMARTGPLMAGSGAEAEHCSWASTLGPVVFVYESIRGLRGRSCLTDLTSPRRPRPANKARVVTRV
jgi:hypothetical protein